MKNKKVTTAVAVFVFVSVAWAYYYSNTNYYQNVQYEAMIERMAAEDVYGGDTPEKTLALFADALKNGDMDLASKYFLRMDWEKKKQELEEMREGGELNELISELGTIKRYRVYSESNIVFSSDSNSDGIVTVDLILTTKGKWKIDVLQ